LKRVDEEVRMAGHMTVVGRIAFAMGFITLAVSGFEAGRGQDLDQRVKAFLDSRRGEWQDLNVSSNDGKILYDLVIKGRYKRALEIGTSTGHSGIWIAWALSKTGGKLVTIEIDEERYRQAVANFKEAGLADIIDARLADAHELVPALKGTFDFVFCDADKDWYKKYFQAVLPKLDVGGCFAAHNVSQGRRGWGTGEFLAYVESLPDLETTFAPGSTAGISISYRKR
jgi:predicted O-methyltransferase YrrM